MKKLILLTLIASFNLTFAQMPTHSTEYTVSAGTVELAAAAHVYNNRLYTTAYHGNFFLIQKNSLNSTPVLAKAISGLVSDGMDPSKPQLVSGSSGLYMAGRLNFGAHLYLIKLDTTSLNSVFTRTYSVGSYTQHMIHQVGILNSGNILIVGSAGNSNASEVGFVLNINPASNGAVVYSSTLTVGTSTVNGVYSFAEISNSTVLFSAQAANGSAMIKAIKVGNAFNFIPSSSNNISAGAFRLYKFGNPKKIIAANIGSICKIDTNLNIIASTPIANQVSRIGTWTGDVYHANGRTYHYNWGNNNLEVFDTSLVSVASKTIAYNAMLTKNVTASGNNMYLIQTLASPVAGRYIVLKTDLDALNYLCFQNFTVPKTFVNLASFSITLNTTTVNCNLGFENPIFQPLTVTSSQTCINNCAAPGAPSNNTPSVNLTICANNSTTLTASGSGTINWYTSPSSTTAVGSGSAFVTPTLSTGTYTYYAEAVTCTTSVNRTPIVINVSACTGINELDVLSFTRIYPNPNNGSFKISLSENVTIEVLDAFGKTIHSELLPIGESTVDVRDLYQGIYFVKVKSNSAEKTFKLIKQ